MIAFVKVCGYFLALGVEFENLFFYSHLRPDKSNTLSSKIPRDEF